MEIHLKVVGRIVSYDSAANLLAAGVILVVRECAIFLVETLQETLHTRLFASSAAP